MHGILALNGRAYFAPSSAGQALCINAEANTMEPMGPELAGRNLIQSHNKKHRSTCALSRAHPGERH